jgi:hypothetical protein
MGPFKPEYVLRAEVGQIELPTRDLFYKVEKIICFCLVWFGLARRVKQVYCDVMSVSVHVFSNELLWHTQKVYERKATMVLTFKRSAVVLVCY